MAGRRLRHANEALPYPFAAISLPAAVQKALMRYRGAKTPAESPVSLTCDSPTVTRFVALNSDNLLLSTYAAVQENLASGGLLEVEMPKLPPF